MKNLDQQQKFVFLWVLTFLFPISLLAQINTAGNDDRAEVELIYQEFTRNMKKGDAGIIVENYYTDDAKFYPPTGGVATGHQQIREVLDGFIESGIHVDLQVDEFEVFGDMAYEYGVATVRNAEGEQLGENEYVVLWKRENGNWKIYRDFIRGSQ